MKKTFKILCTAAVSLAVLASCDQENIKDMYEPMQANEVSFAAEVFSSTSMDQSVNTVNVVIARGSADRALTVPLIHNMPNCVSVPASVDFAQGEYEANVELQLLDNFYGGRTYSGIIQIADTTLYNEATPYPAIQVKLSKALVWQKLGKGEFYDPILDDILTPQVNQAVNAGYPLYRIVNPYVESKDSTALKAIVDNLQAAGFEDAGVEGVATAEIEISIRESSKADVDTLVWSGSWTNGVMVIDSIPASSIYYYYPADAPADSIGATGSKVSVADMYKDCIRLENGIMQFRPYIVAYGEGGKIELERADWYCYFSLPEADVTVTAELPNLPVVRKDEK